MSANDNNKPDIDRIIIELKLLDWTKGLSEDAIEVIAKSGEYVLLQYGDYAQHAGENNDSIFFIFSGKMQASVKNIFGKILLERTAIRGSAFGLFALSQSDQVVADVMATEPSTGIRIKTNKLSELMSRCSALQINLFRLMANMTKQIVMVDRKKVQPSVIGIIHHSPSSRPLTQQLLKRLAKIEATPCVGSDDLKWKPEGNFPFSLLFEKGSLVNQQQRQSKLKEWADLGGRIIIDIEANHEPELLNLLFSYADKILWCVKPEYIDATIKTLTVFQNNSPGWKNKVCLVWILDNKNMIPPYRPELPNLVERDFKVSFSEPAEKHGRQLNHGIERIIHHLRGIQIGIALGGGAARGMAHLGVLKTLEQNGIYVDMISGTSAGAMTGTCYAYGLDMDYAVKSFVKDLTLPWIFRRIPAGSYWYLLYKYRKGLFDPMLRRYFGNTRLEQFPIPMLTVTVDLVHGVPVVRETGDAVKSIIESINLPGLSVPLISEGRALIDGGLINNIPANVLVSKGCNYVIASSVTAKLEPEFLGIRPDRKDQKHEKPSTLKTLMRGNMVQSFNMNSVGVQPADFVIEPDVTKFDLSEFERTNELAAIGSKTASEAIATIKQHLSKLDNKLFPL